MENNVPVSFLRRTSKRRLQIEEFFSFLLLFLPMLVVARVTLFVRPRVGTEYSQVDTMAAIQITVVIVLLISILAAPKFYYIIKQLLGSSFGALIGYYIICLISALWSINPTYTAYRAVEVIVLSVAIHFSLQYITNELKLEKRVLLTTCAIVLMGIFTHIKLGGFSISSLHTNTYSAVGGMIFVYCLAEYMVSKKADRHRRSLLRNSGIFGLFFLIIGTSSASYISALVGLVLISIFSRNKGLFLLSVVLILIGALLMTPEDILQLLFPGKSVSQIETGTGRSWLWNIYYHEILKSPWIGHGFATSTRVGRFYVTNTHNGYIAVLLGTGTLGAMVFLVFLLRFIREGMLAIVAPINRSLGASIAVATGLINNFSVSIIGEQWNIILMGLTLFLVLQLRLDLITRNLKRYKVYRAH